jgi:hypothetical protein
VSLCCAASPIASRTPGLISILRQSYFESVDGTIPIDISYLEAIRFKLSINPFEISHWIFSPDEPERLIQNIYFKFNVSRYLMLLYLASNGLKPQNIGEPVLMI